MLAIFRKSQFFQVHYQQCFYNLFFALFYYMKIDFQVNLMLDFLFASLFIAVGYYCCITANASTVGMDVIAMAINKKRPDFSIVRGIRYINFMVLILGFLTYGFKSVVIGLLFSFVNSYLLDFLLKRSSR
ncbi:YitT family protein [Enterococcus gallinarum]